MPAVYLPRRVPEGFSSLIFPGVSGRAANASPPSLSPQQGQGGAEPKETFAASSMNFQLTARL